MKLKQFQTDALDALRKFLELSHEVGAESAYQLIVEDPLHGDRLKRYRAKYKGLPGLPEVPYVCLRLPTGGGKTLLATHAIGVARDAWIEKDYPMVLWLVPTNTIRQQTVDALRAPQHSYRQALDGAFSGRVRIFDISEFDQIRPWDIADHCCVVVGTLQSLRVTNTEGRRVYAHSEKMETHFLRRPNDESGLERTDEGAVKYSFANLLHLHRPLMIVDEAHNAVTNLTREMQLRIRPCAVVELTATPRDSNGRMLNNIIYSVSAQELRDSEMIKLPIMLSEHSTWENAVNGAIRERAALAECSANDAQYIRPLVLFQAQDVNQEVNVEALRNHLLDVENIPAEKIAVATGDQRDLDGIDILDKACPIEYVITVEALREGWDCSFAYVFCSVSRVRSAQHVEQLLGRVLRMPYAKRRNHEKLNKAYAHVSEPEFGEAAKALVDKLIHMGFEETEANDSVVSTTTDAPLADGLFDPGARVGPTFTHTVSAPEDQLLQLKELGEQLDIIQESSETEVTIAIAGPVSDDVAKQVTRALPTDQRKKFGQALFVYQRNRSEAESPAGQGKQLTVPKLMVQVGQQLMLAETDLLLESHDWSILDHQEYLDAKAFEEREKDRRYEIGVENDRVTYQVADKIDGLPFNVEVEDWTEERLINWLDKKVREPDIKQSESLKWLSGQITHLVNERNISLAALMGGRYWLARKIGKKWSRIRDIERNKAYQQQLFSPESNVCVSFDDQFSFGHGMYQGVPLYRGAWRPNKHFLGRDQVPEFDGAEDGEEVRCAQAVDNLESVEFWIRNVAKHDRSFWLPTASGKFYPDFVAKLKSGALLVVEYKGAHLSTAADASEKRAIGELWERESGGQGLFIMVEKSVAGKDVRAQLLKKIEGK